VLHYLLVFRVINEDMITIVTTTHASEKIT